MSCQRLWAIAGLETLPSPDDMIVYPIRQLIRADCWIKFYQPIWIADLNCGRLSGQFDREWNFNNKRGHVLYDRDPSRKTNQSKVTKANSCNDMFCEELSSAQPHPTSPARILEPNELLINRNGIFFFDKANLILDQVYCSAISSG